jgi:hypothetical protein
MHPHLHQHLHLHALINPSTPPHHHTPLPQYTVEDLPAVPVRTLPCSATCAEFHPSDPTLLLLGTAKGCAEWWALGTLERVGEVQPRQQALLEVQVTRVAWAPDASAIGGWRCWAPDALVHLLHASSPAAVSRVLKGP